MHRLIQLPDPPTDGRQFIAIWTYEGAPWAETRRFHKNTFQLCKDDGDGEVNWVNIDETLEDCPGAKYYVTRDSAPSTDLDPLPPFTD